MNPMMYVKEGIMVLLVVVITGMAFRISYLGGEVAEAQLDVIKAEKQVDSLSAGILNQNRMIADMKEMEAKQAAKMKAAQTNMGNGLVLGKQKLGLVLAQKQPVDCEAAIGWLVEEAQK